ncbi:MAG: hypothetical protein QNJ31_01250 [Candidatus Caenarcaniphilales bacterium]|nr:hypothetical protein [Candidatus Caenarcaniphilales bacterium]
MKIPIVKATLLASFLAIESGSAALANRVNFPPRFKPNHQTLNKQQTKGIAKDLRFPQKGYVDVPVYENICKKGSPSYPTIKKYNYEGITFRAAYDCKNRFPVIEMYWGNAGKEPEGARCPLEVKYAKKPFWNLKLAQFSQNPADVNSTSRSWRLQGTRVFQNTVFWYVDPASSNSSSLTIGVPKMPQHDNVKKIMIPLRFSLTCSMKPKD